MSAELSTADLESYAKRLAGDPLHRVAQNAVTRSAVEDVALDRSVVTSMDHSVSHLLDDRAATNQQQSGRCWLFAGLNLLRGGAAERMGVKDFEFSQNHLLFWDKMEKANHWLESIITTAQADVDDRTVAHLLSTPAEDGGQWNMFVALVRKHGLVPRALMPETHSSSKTSSLNRALAQLLRRAARDLRAQAGDGSDVEHLRATKDEVLGTVYRVLTIHLGTPPTSFTWQWADKDRAFHRDEPTTPREFAARYAVLPYEEHVCLVHDPRPGSEVGRTYTVEHLGNVVGAPPVVYLNVGIDLLRRLAMESIVGGEPVWFGCDTGRMDHAELGFWDAALYDFPSVYGADWSLGKADRLLHGDTLMTHAMLFTGVDVIEDRPRRWRVENSWGTEKADKGFWTMNDNWFTEHVFEVAVRRSALPADLRTALDAPPVVLPAWDPMGALAHAR